MSFAKTTRPPSLKQALVLSLGMHLSLVVAVGAASFFSPRGESWGGVGGGAISVGLVRSVGIPLPRPETVTTSRVVDDTKGLFKSEPKPVVKPTDAKPIQEFSKAKTPKYVTRPSKVLEDEAQAPHNAVPYGAGGAPSIQYNQFTVAGQTQGGLAMSGGGSGEFGSRFPWYVEAVRRRISNNWLQSAIEPNIRWAPRVVVTFQILPNGALTNIQILKSSGYPSVDYSARRAILDSSPVERLPSGYGGSVVNVEFWFEFKR